MPTVSMCSSTRESSGKATPDASPLKPAKDISESFDIRSIRLASMSVDGPHRGGHARLLYRLHRHVVGNTTAAKFPLDGMRYPDRCLWMDNCQSDQRNRHEHGQDEKSNASSRFGRVVALA